MWVAEEGPLAEFPIEELLRRARAGDEHALEQLFQKARDLLKELASRPKYRLPSGEAQPSDIAQEVTLKAYKHFLTFRGESSVEWHRWLKTSFLNHFKQVLRDAGRQKRDAEETISLDGPEPQAVPAQQKSPSQAVAHQEQWHLLLANLAQLVPAQREAITWCYLKELRVAEAATKMNRSKEAVTSLLQRGLATLRSQMAGEPEPGDALSKRIADALLDLLERRDAGEQVDPEAFATLYPDCADELRILFRLIDELQELPATATSMNTLFPTGFRIGDHEVVRRAVSGAMCDVHEAHHVATGEVVAIKSLRPALALDLEIAARFLNEAKLLQELRHPHLVKGVACGVIPEGPPYMVLEWLPLDLHRALERTGGRLTPAASARLAAQLADALATLHARGIIHRDLKPANILLAGEAPETWVAKLADLGLAKRLPGAASPGAGIPISTARNASLGTCEYMAPEQWVSAKDAGPEVDVYALGVILFQMLAGQPPFIAGEEKHLMYFHVVEPPPMERLDGQASPEVTALVGRMLAKTPAERPTMRETFQALAVS